MGPLIVILLLIGLVVAFVVGLYNGLVRLRQQVKNAWSQIDVQLKRRYDLIPNLVETVKGYAKHEKETLEAVIQARNAAVSAQGVEQQAKAENMLTGALRQIFALSERYPDLKANQNFRDLQVQLEGTENRITIARQRYIQSIKEFNNLVTVPPTSWYNAAFLSHDKKPQFTVDDEVAIQQPPKVKF